jgi:hypothetical protein
VLVYLKLEKRLFSHYVFEKVADEGVRSTAEIGDIECVQVPEIPDCAARAHACVCSHTAHECHGTADLLAFGYTAFEAPGQGIAESGDDLVVRRSDLLKMDHVGFGEDSATPRNPWRIHRPEGDGAEFFNGETEARRLLIEEGAGPGGTKGIHGEVFDPERSVSCLAILIQNDELRILTTYVDHCPGLR